jgi:tetratricopeptide (TPR) repeat protein
MVYQNLGAICMINFLCPGENATGDRQNKKQRDAYATAARGFLQTAVYKNIRNAAASRLMMNLLFCQQDVDGAKKWGRQVLQINQAETLTTLHMGYIYLFSGQPEIAIQEFRVAGAPPEFILRIGAKFYSDFQRAGEEDIFLRLFQNLVENYPIEKQASAFGYLGIYYANRNRWIDAVEAERSALRLNPDFAYWRLWLGVSLARLGKTDSAKAELLKGAVTADKTVLAHIYSQLGEIYGQEKNVAKEIESFSVALSLLPDSFEHRSRLAQAYLQNKEYGLALNEYRVLATLHPYDKELREKCQMIESHLLSR